MSEERVVAEDYETHPLDRDRLNPDEQAFLAVLDEFTAQIRAAEPEITAGVCDAVPVGAELCKLETKFKSMTSLYRKTRVVVKRHKRRYGSAENHAEAARMALKEIDDALRYSLRSSHSSRIVRDASAFLTDAHRDSFVVTKLVDMYSDLSRYKGLHANLKHEGDAVRIIFEMQFHSVESLLADAATHPLYEEFRTSADPARRQELHDEIREHYVSVPNIDTSTGSFPISVESVVFSPPKCEAGK